MAPTWRVFSYVKFAASAHRLVSDNGVFPESVRHCGHDQLVICRSSSMFFQIRHAKLVRTHNFSTKEQHHWLGPD